LSKNNKDERYLEGKMDGMAQAYEIFDDALRKLRNSIDNVWMIYDQDDFIRPAITEQKDRLHFSLNTLFVLREMFDGEYDSKIDEVKALIDRQKEE
jgi:predicted NBD/HSP70 family sugar kinase